MPKGVLLTQLSPISSKPPTAPPKLLSTSNTSEQSENTVSISSLGSYQTTYTPTHYMATDTNKPTTHNTTPNEQTILKTNHTHPYLMEITTATKPDSISDINFDPCLGVSPNICNTGTETMPTLCECDDSGIWTIIQKRFDGSVDFYRNWTEYKEGFGDSNREFWLGNEAIHMITADANYSLKIFLTGWDSITKYALYDVFKIADEANGYRLTIHGFSGDAGDSLTVNHNGQMFSTFDMDNDGQKNM